MNTDEMRLFVARTARKLREMRDACDETLERCWPENDPDPEQVEQPLRVLYAELAHLDAAVEDLAHRYGVRP